LLSEILEADASLSESVKGLMSQAKAAGTMVNHDGMMKKFVKFCTEKGYIYPDLTEKAAMYFVIQMDRDGATMSSLCQVKPTLALVEKLAGKKVSSFSETVDTLLTAAKRRAVESKPIVQKAGKLPEIRYSVCTQFTTCLTWKGIRQRIRSCCCENYCGVLHLL
jgi:hypothetical protein